MYTHILVALDGSEPSRFAGDAAIAVAAATGARVTACHIYGAQMHRRRFIDMEPGLPAKYQEQERLSDLRTAHDRLMDEGFRALSTGYIEDFVRSSQDAGVAIDSATAEGRSYIGILQLAQTQRADLIVLGADGLGAVGDGMLGGTTSRVLANAPCDVLIARRAMHGGPILTGVDGSEEALEAAARAVALGGATHRPIHVAAVYDPQFHTRVFVTMSRSLSAERQAEVGLANQEQLHDDIINDGLGKLYAEFLKEAEHRFGGNGAVVKTSLTTGKAYQALDSQARQLDADLIVLGRYGHHRESCSLLGSNAENLIRSTSANVLLVGAALREKKELQVMEPARATNHQSSIINHQLTWSPDAEARLHRVPSFVRSMARRAVENAVRESGKDCVSVEDFNDVAARFGMGRGGNA
jgi:nucleotide-binding universal stress UspA family protein